MNEATLFPGFEFEPPAKVLSSWVAFDASGFPFAFAEPKFCTMAAFAKDCGTAAVRIELVEGAERSRLLRIHAGFA